MRAPCALLPCTGESERVLFRTQVRFAAAVAVQKGGRGA